MKRYVKGTDPLAKAVTAIQLVTVRQELDWQALIKRRPCGRSKERKAPAPE